VYPPQSAPGPALGSEIGKEKTGQRISSWRRDRAVGSGLLALTVATVGSGGGMGFACTPTRAMSSEDIAREKRMACCRIEQLVGWKRRSEQNGRNVQKLVVGRNGTPIWD
jgi:hypothetical protein